MGIFSKTDDEDWGPFWERHDPVKIAASNKKLEQYKQHLSDSVLTRRIGETHEEALKREGK